MSLSSKVKSAFDLVATDISTLAVSLLNKQQKLISGTNIATINGKNQLASGNLEIYGSRVLTFGGMGVPEVANDVTPWIVLHRKSTIKKLRLMSKTAPSGGAFTVSIKKSLDGVTFTTIVAALSNSASTKISSTDISIDVEEGTILRIDITSVNGAADWTCQLESIEKL